MSVHVAYGGAHLFQAGTPAKWRSVALAAFERTAPTPTQLIEHFSIPESLAETVHARLDAVLRSEAALTSLRIDFEDGYGVRPHEEEDAAAEDAARALDAMPAGLALGVRPKSFAPATRARAVRTLRRFFGALRKPPPADFVVTLPKVSSAHDVAIAIGALATIESETGIAPLSLEIMAETPALFSELERRGLVAVHAAAEGRLRSVHFGAYDMLSALGVPGHEQSLAHPFCTPLRLTLARAAAPFELPLYDGATLAMPVGPHKDAAPGSAERAHNDQVVRDAMRVHARHCTDALSLGFAGSWDLHPAQLVPRHIATIAFYLRALPDTQKRLGAFLRNAARATRADQIFDDAASARGLLRFVVRGLEIGALQAADLEELPVPVESLRRLSFDQLVAQPASAQLPR